MKANLGTAWIILTSILTLHVIDQAVNDFLPIYNAMAKIVGYLPVFTFNQWIIGLICAIIILFLLSRYALRQRLWICYLSLFYGVFMILNGIGHIAMTIYFKEPSPGFYSAVLLILSAIFLILVAIRTLRSLKLE